MSRPGKNQYLADTKHIAAGGTATFTFTVDTEGFILVAADAEVDGTPFCALTTCPFVVTEVKRRTAGKDEDSSMGQGNIPLALFCRMGTDRNKFFYEEPLKGNSKVQIQVTNGDGQAAHDVTIVLWGATPGNDPYYARPEDWPKLFPYMVVQEEKT
ncbi:MAG: hypothetical protein PHC52_00615 [Syntrophales bacterium]|nr:hypothetical protein [Syntrophales bacterium]